MAMTRATTILLALLVPALAYAKSGDQIVQNCGPEPKIDPSAKAPIQVAERLLDRVLKTRAKVFRAFSSEYRADRARIIKRNKRLPKSQHLPVPAEKNDEELRRMPKYLKRIKVAHASSADEAAAQKKLAAELAKLSGKNRKYHSCRDAIVKRIRSAPTQTRAALLRINLRKRLREENARLLKLKRLHKDMLAINRTDKNVMTPVISAAICANKDLQRLIDREVRTVSRQSKLASRDASEEIAVLEERKEDLKLEIIELRRDIKNMRGRQTRCGKSAALITCIKDERQSPKSNPPTCRNFGMELELLGYKQLTWE